MDLIGGFLLIVGLVVEVVAECELTLVAVDVVSGVGIVIEDTVFFVLDIFFVVVDVVVVAGEVVEI